MVSTEKCTLYIYIIQNFHLQLHFQILSVHSNGSLDYSIFLFSTVHPASLGAQATGYSHVICSHAKKPNAGYPVVTLAEYRSMSHAGHV